MQIIVEIFKISLIIYKTNIYYCRRYNILISNFKKYNWSLYMEDNDLITITKEEYEKYKKFFKGVPQYEKW